MNKNIEIKRLTKAISNLTNILVATTYAKVPEQMPVATTPAHRYSHKPIDKLMTKRDLATYLNVSLRTVQNLMNNRSLPYIRLNGRIVRFMLPNVQNALARKTIG